jgi:RHH-type proline utilization regulon transcriptional repressor/proline dehydrogenase/delta 1-pyrroline-5-carboxylate dehydrogenase
MMPSDFESRIRETGLRLYDLVKGETPSLFDKKFWTGKVMEWCMKNNDFKVEMFRFIDVLPYLTTKESIAKHFTEYFCRSDQNFPMTVQLGLAGACHTDLIARKTARSMAENIEKMGRNFIAAATPQEALPILKGLRSQGMAFSIDLLGEAVVSEKEAEVYLGRYLELFDLMSGAQKDWEPLGGVGGTLDWGHAPKVNISVKPSAMYSQMNPRAFDYSVAQAKERLKPIFRRAVEMGGHVTLDMEHYDLKNLTLALYRSLLEESEFREYPYTGIAVQAYLKGSREDLRELVQWGRKRKQRFSIRLVKGAYWDSEVVWARQRNWPVPVFTNKHETDANFEKLARYLMENHEWIYFACGSQNIRSVAYVIETAKALKVPDDRMEYQILYGMAEPVRNALRKAGLPLRLYSPIGDIIPGMAYLVRRLLENTANESFLVQSFAQDVSRDELLKNPLIHFEKENVSSETPPGASDPDQKGPFKNEPNWDWTLSENRASFEKALAKVKKAFPYDVPISIGGNEIKTGAEIRSTNPNDPDQVVGITGSAGIEEAERAVSAAKAAFPKWREMAPGDRVEYLFKAADAARKMRYDLAAMQVYEVGKTWSEADADVCEAIDFLEYYGREMLRLATPRRMDKVPGEKSHLFYEPRGVAAVIAPWNFPLAISMGMTSAALVTGNTVVYKPSSRSSVTGAMMVKIFEKTKLPGGVLNFLPGPGGEVGNYLVTHPDVALIAFTGSKEVGLKIIEKAGKTSEGMMHIKSVVAEMGGKNAIVLDEDADLDEALVHVIYSAFGYQGQKCSACSRVIVLEEIYEKFITRLKAAVESVELGPTEEPKSFFGSVIDATAKERILRYIDIGKKEGKLLLERDLPELKVNFVPLTIFTDVRPEHRISQEEIFGPVLAIIKVREFDEALEVANSTPYALTGSLFSRSPENIAKARREFRVGNLYINRGCTGALVGRHPFGGFKMSGVGSKAGGPDYLHQFLLPRNVAENTLRRGFAPDEN